MGGGSIRRVLFEHVYADDDRASLQDLSFTLRAGDLLVLFGAAAHLVLDVVLGQTLARSGFVALNGRAIPAADPPSVVLAGVGLVGPEPRLPGPTAFDAITTYLHLLGCGRREARERTSAILDQFGAGRLAHADLATLSSDCLWVLDLARALAAEPHVILVDDPRRGGVASVWDDKLHVGLIWAACLGCAVLVRTRDPQLGDKLAGHRAGDRLRMLIFRHGKGLDDSARWRRAR